MVMWRILASSGVVTSSVPVMRKALISFWIVSVERPVRQLPYVGGDRALDGKIISGAEEPDLLPILAEQIAGLVSVDL